MHRAPPDAPPNDRHMTDHFISTVWMSIFIGLIVLTLGYAVYMMLKGKKD